MVTGAKIAHFNVWGALGRIDNGSRAHAYIRSALLEAAGRKDEALASYRALGATFRPNDAGSLVDGTRKAIARLASR